MAEYLIGERIYNLKADFHRLRKTLLPPILLRDYRCPFHIYICINQILNRKIQSQATRDFAETRFTRFSKDGVKVRHLCDRSSRDLPNISTLPLLAGNWAERQKPRLSSFEPPLDT